MKSIFVLILFLSFISVYAQDKTVTKNGKEIEVNKDATTSEKGIVKLAGDLGGTADAPTVPGLAAKQNTLTLTTTGSGAASLTGSILNIPSSTGGSPFNLQGTATDAGTDKTSAISRDGSITVNSGFVRANSGGYSLTMNPADLTGPRFQLGTTTTPGQFFEFGSYNNQNNFDNKARDFQIFGNSINGIMLKATTGNVGIGTRTPQANLHVQSATTSTMFLGNNATGKTYGIFRTSADTNGYLEISSIKTSGSIWGDLVINQSGGNVGIGTTTPTTALNVNGSFGTNIRSVAATSTLLTTDHTIIITGTAITTQTLPAPNNRQYLEIKNKSNSTATITGHINNVAATNYTLAAESSITLKSDGTTWWIIDETVNYVTVNYVAEVYQTIAAIVFPGTVPTSGTDIVSINLPNPGVWELEYFVRGYNATASGGTAVCITNGSNVLQANSEMMIAFSTGTPNTIQASASRTFIVTTTLPNTVFKLRGYSIVTPNSGASLSDLNGRTYIKAKKLN